MAAWRVDADLSQINVPPTVSALVAARLERLEPSERDLIGRASVVGKVFQRSAVTELSPPERREDLRHAAHDPGAQGTRPPGPIRNHRR